MTVRRYDLADMRREVARARARKRALAGGFGFGFGSAAASCASAAASFDPATLSLTGWWRASFSGSNPAGVASAGSSGSNNLSNGANPPTATGTLNGLTVADFDGTNDEYAGAAFSTYWTTTAWSGWALVNADAINTNNTANYALNDVIVGTNGTAEICVYLRGTGPYSAGVTIGSGVGAETGFVIGSWALVQFRGDPANGKEIRVNSGAWAGQSGGTIGSLAAALSIGDLAGGFFDGKMADIGLAASRLSDATFDNVKSYVNSRYSLAL